MGKYHDTPCAECSNEHCMVKKLLPGHAALLQASKTEHLYPAEQVVFYEGARVFGAFFIKRGKVKVVSSNSQGREQIVRLAADGHMLGHMGYGHERYPIGAFALEESRICFIDNETLYRCFMEQPKFTFEVMMFYSRELRKSELRAKCFAQMTTEEKVIYALLYVTDTFGAGHTAEIELGRQELANLAGTNADQISRSLSLLKSGGFIETQGRKIFIPDTQKLRERIAAYQLIQVH